MFRRAVIKLTVLYSFLFFILFWSFSAGLYAYLRHSFTQSYVTQVKERVRHEIGSRGSFASYTEFSLRHSNAFLNKSAEVTLENFRKGLILINLALLFAIPSVSWYLVRKTLLPIREVMQKQKRFVSDASHELLTPLTIISNEIEVALQQQREMSYYVKTLDTLKGEIFRLSDLVGNLLILAKHEDRSQPIPMQEVELIDVISKVVSGLTRKFQEKKINPAVHFPEENIVVKGNATMLEQLFTNLIDNAFKFSSPDSDVAISIDKKKQHAQVTIQNRGEGIPKEEQQKVFDRFYRIDSARSRTHGYGLGLPIAQGIVQLHGGTLSLQSVPGKTTTFTVTLPALTQ